MHLSSFYIHDGKYYHVDQKCNLAEHPSVLQHKTCNIYFPEHLEHPPIPCTSVFFTALIVLFNPLHPNELWYLLPFSVICERTVSTGEIIAGILAGAFFLLISKLTKESFGYGDSILIVIMGAFLGFWSLMSVLFMAFFMAGLFSVIMLLKTKFHKKSKFPFITFLMAAYAGGIILNGY